MRNLIRLYKFFLPLTILIFTFQSQAQTEKELLAQLASEEQEAVNALVLYPKDTRLAILEASLYPEALIKMESIQVQTSSKFKELMQSYPQDVQEMVWDLTRYPNLFQQLAKAGNSNKAIEEVLKKYPKVIHKRAKQAAVNNPALIAAVNNLNQSAAETFATLLRGYPSNVQTNFRQLLALPEVLTLLTENIRLTILVGDLYEKEPDLVIQKTDSVSLEVARQNAQEIEEWKENLAENPEVMEEFKAAAESFNDEYAFDDEYYDFENEPEDNDDIYYDEYRKRNDYQTLNVYYDYNYPYWFGYPYWYNVPRWRAYPYWYDWGFYYGNGGSIIVLGLPSFYFVSWYFYYPNHHVHWSHLSAHFVRHHHHHIHHGNSITTGVRNWQNRNREIVNGNWIKDDSKLPRRMEEYGKFEVARTKYNNKHTDKPLTQNEYADHYKKRYPTLTKSAKEVEKSRPKPIYKVPPASRKPMERKSKVSKSETTKPRTVKVPEKKSPKRTKSIPKVNKAKEYHKNTWEKPKSSKNRVVRPTSPRIKTKQQKSTPKKSQRSTTSKRKKN